MAGSTVAGAIPWRNWSPLVGGSEQFWVAVAERDGAGRFIARADERLTAFLELESAIPFQKLEAQQSTVAERCV
jgi:hypothetical protein